MSTVYIDFEQSPKDDIIEIGAICVKNRRVITILHSFVKPDIDDPYLYVKNASYSHCIPIHVLKENGRTEEEIKVKFLQWIQEEVIHPVTIKGNGLDVTKEALEKWIPGLSAVDSIQYQQVTLHPWAQRMYAYYHINTYVMKRLSTSMKCNHLKHSIQKSKHREGRCCTSTLTRLSKDMYGFHCALFDAFELAFFEQTIPYYCCDTHFNLSID